jgi:hypothetical protein
MTWNNESERHKLSQMGISTRHAQRFSNVDESYKKAYGTPVYKNKFWTIHVGEEVVLLTDDPKNWGESFYSLAVITPPSKFGGVRVAYYKFDGTLDVKNSFVVDVGFIAPLSKLEERGKELDEAMRLHKYAKTYYIASSPLDADNIILNMVKRSRHRKDINKDVDNVVNKWQKDEHNDIEQKLFDSSCHNKHGEVDVRKEYYNRDKTLENIPVEVR